MKLEARHFCEDDIDVRVDWINNELINSSMFFNLPATVNETLTWFKNNIRNNSRVDFTFICNGVQIAGMGGITHIDNCHKNAEFYVMVNPDMQGVGIGKKISRWIFNYAFLKLDLNKVYLYTNDTNLFAYKIYEDCGFKLEGILRKHKVKDGQFINRRFYGLLRDDWRMQDWKENEINYLLK